MKFSTRVDVMSERLAAESKWIFVLSLNSTYGQTLRSERSAIESAIHFGVEISSAPCRVSTKFRRVRTIG